jgi:hypothetical protein
VQNQKGGYQDEKEAIQIAVLAMALSLAMVVGLMASGVMAESNTTATQTVAAVTVNDNNPAIYVAQKTVSSVVGVTPTRRTGIPIPARRPRT